MLIKKITCYILLLFLFVFCIDFGTEAFDISSKSAVVLDARTNRIVFQKNAFEKRSMASTTKIMTAYLAIESGKLSDTVNITGEMTRAEGTSLGLHAGEKITLGDLVYGMMLESGNDAANAVALYLSGGFSDFASLMNEKARQIGMKNTNFVTPSGLDDENHYSTAYDMALLASHCIRDSVFRRICSSKRYTAQLIEPQTKLYFSNHNRLLGSVEGVFGVKTGFTKKSGRCLVSAIEKDGAVLVVVTLNAPNDWNDHQKLYDYAFEKLEHSIITPQFPDSIHVVGGDKCSVRIKSLCNDFEIALYGNTGLKQRVYLPHFVYAPVSCGDCLGRIDFFCGDSFLKSTLLVADESIRQVQPTYEPKISLKDRIIKGLKSLFE